MRITIALVLIALGLAACEGNEEPSGESPAAPDGDWVLIDGVAAVADFPITLSIAGNDASGRAACNSYSATVKVNGGSISFGDVGQTLMACTPEVMEAESAFLQALQSVETFSAVGTRLTLGGGGVSLDFEPVAAVPTSALTDTEWTLTTLIEGESASSVAGDPATLILAADGTLSATTGCRTLTGRWLENGGVIVVPELSADGDCPDELWKQDSLVVTVIGDEFRAEVDGDQLRLTSMGGDGLVYQAER